MKLYIKITKGASGTRRVLINRTESCEKDSWTPLNPRTHICVTVFGEEEVGGIGPGADWLAHYLDCERVYEADYIPHTDEIRIDALDEEAHTRTVRLNCVCFEAIDDHDTVRRFKKLSISRMTAVEVGNLESMYRNAHKDTRRTEPRVFMVDPCNAIADRGVDITVFDPKKALEPGRKYFGNLHLVIVPGEIEPRFKIVFSECSRVGAYSEYFDKTKRVYQFQSSPESSFNLADIRYVKRVGDRLFGNTGCVEWVNLDITTELVTSLNGKIERDGDDFVVRPELLEDEVLYTCHYWPEKDCLVLDDFGKQLVKKHGCTVKVPRLSVIDTNGNYVKLRIGRMVKFEQMAILKMYSDASPHWLREPLKTGSEPYGSLRGPLYYAEVCVYDPHKQLSEVDPDKLYDISLVIVPDEIEPRFVLNARDQVVINSRQGGKTMHAMYLAARLAADIRVQKNAGCSVPKIERVIFNAPATVVMWADGTKTVVKAQKGEKYDPEKGLAMAISKKALGNGSKYYDTFKKWVPEKKKPARKPKAKKTPTEE